MKIINFTLQDAPDFSMGLETDLNLPENGECTVNEETAIALIIYNRFPELRKHNRRIKHLVVVDEEGNIYTTTDFDTLGSLTKERKR